MKPNAGTEVHSQLLLEYERQLKSIAKWRRRAFLYRFLNISLFMTCKLIVPTAALIVAVNMISIVLDKQLISSFWSSIIAAVVTFLASVEAALNPGAKKRLAFALYNELTSIENKLHLTMISNDDEKLREKLAWTDDEMKRLLNHYSENGY